MRTQIAHGAAVAECWQRERSRYPNHPTEHLTIRAHITAAGRADAVTVEGARNLRLPVCLRAELPRMDFGRGAAVQVTVATTLAVE